MQYNRENFPTDHIGHDDHHDLDDDGNCDDDMKRGMPEAAGRANAIR